VLSDRVILDVPLPLVLFVPGLLAAQPGDRHPGRDTRPELPEAGGFYPGVVPGPAGYAPAGPGLRDLPGHRLPVQG
jgi:hypothetical protein